VASSIALAAALIWIAHPLQTEAVTYLIQRSESLAGLFYLLTLYFVARGSGSPRSLPWYAAAVGASALGMACKPVMATAPVMALVYDRMFLSGSFRRVWGERGRLHMMLFATIGLVPLLLAAAPMDWRYSSGLKMPGIGPGAYAMTETGVVLHYLRLGLWPHPLCLDYAWPIARHASEIVAPAAAIALLAGGSVLLALRGGPLGFLGVWFFLILAPTSSVIPVLDPAFEHRMYLPLAALALLVTLGGYEALRWMAARLAWPWWTMRVAAASLVTLAVLVLGTLTVRRNAHYRSAVAIWSDTVAKRPGNLRARVDLAYALAREGGFEAGMAQLEEVLRRAPDYPWAHLAAGYFLTKQGRLDEALPHLRHAERELPASAEAHYLLGSVLSERGELDEAVAQLTQAVRLEPWRAEAQNNLGAALNRKGDWDAAAHHLVEALRLDPGYANAHFNLGVALEGKGDLERARQEFQAALELKPDLGLARQALDSLRAGGSR
jgi:tetratricopeptide (TPR) repeat protein